MPYIPTSLSYEEINNMYKETSGFGAQDFRGDFFDVLGELGPIDEAGASMISRMLDSGTGSNTKYENALIEKLAADPNPAPEFVDMMYKLREGEGGIGRLNKDSVERLDEVLQSKDLDPQRGVNVEPPELEPVRIDPEEVTPPEVKAIDVAKNPEASIADVETAYRTTAGFGASNFRSEYFQTLEARVAVNGTLNAEEVKLVAEMFEDAEYPGSRERDELGEELMQAYFESNSPSAAFTEIVNDAYGDMTWFENRGNLRDEALEQFMALDNPSAAQVEFMTRVSEKMSRDEQAQFQEHLETLNTTESQPESTPEPQPVDSNVDVSPGMVRGAERRAETDTEVEAKATEEASGSTQKTENKTEADPTSTLLAAGALSGGAGATPSGAEVVGNDAGGFSFANFDFSNIGGIFQAIMELIAKFLGQQSETEATKDVEANKNADSDHVSALNGSDGNSEDQNKTNDNDPDEPGAKKDEKLEANANAAKPEDGASKADTVARLTGDQPESSSSEPDETSEDKPEAKQKDDLEAEDNKPELDEEQKAEKPEVPDFDDPDFDIEDLIQYGLDILDDVYDIDDTNFQKELSELSAILNAEDLTQDGLIDRLIEELEQFENAVDALPTPLDVTDLSEGIDHMKTGAKALAPENGEAREAGAPEQKVEEPAQKQNQSPEPDQTNKHIEVPGAGGRFEPMNM